MHKKVLFLLILIPTFSFSDACWGYSDVEDIHKEAMLDPTNKKIWNGWEAPPGAKESWEIWIDKFKDATKQNMGYLTEEDIAAGKLPAGHNVPGWPADWHDLAEGFGGIEPPPWAYVPKNLGRPTRCYLQPLAGNCESRLERFGYNPFVDECQSFAYTGCGGNMNNFLTKEACESECINPVMGCDPDSGIPQFFA